MLINDGGGRQFGVCNVDINGVGHKLHANIVVLQSKQFWNPHTHCPLRTIYGVAHFVHILELPD